METTLTLRKRSGFNEVASWKQFCARRSHLIHTLSSNSRKASEQDEQVRVLAAESCAEYGFSSSAQPDFEKSSIAGIQSVRRNQKRSSRNPNGTAYQESAIRRPSFGQVSDYDTRSSQGSIASVANSSISSSSGQTSQGSQMSSSQAPPTPNSTHSDSQGNQYFDPQQVAALSSAYSRSNGKSNGHAAGSGPNGSAPGSYDPVSTANGAQPPHSGVPSGAAHLPPHASHNFSQIPDGTIQQHEAPMTQSLVSRLDVSRGMIKAASATWIESSAPVLAHMSAEGVLSAAVAAAAVHAKLSPPQSSAMRDSSTNGTSSESSRMASDPRSTTTKSLERIGALAASLVHGPNSSSASQASFVSLAQAAHGSLEDMRYVSKPMASKDSFVSDPGVHQHPIHQHHPPPQPLHIAHPTPPGPTHSPHEPPPPLPHGPPLAMASGPSSQPHSRPASQPQPPTQPTQQPTQPQSGAAPTVVGAGSATVAPAMAAQPGSAAPTPAASAAGPTRVSISNSAPSSFTPPQHYGSAHSSTIASHNHSPTSSPGHTPVEQPVGKPVPNQHSNTPPHAPQSIPTSQAPPSPPQPQHQPPPLASQPHPQQPPPQPQHPQPQHPQQHRQQPRQGPVIVPSPLNQVAQPMSQHLPPQQMFPMPPPGYIMAAQPSPMHMMQFAMPPSQMGQPSPQVQPGVQLQAPTATAQAPPVQHQPPPQHQQQQQQQQQHQQSQPPQPQQQQPPSQSSPQQHEHSSSQDPAGSQHSPQPQNTDGSTAAPEQANEHGILNPGPDRLVKIQYNDKVLEMTYSPMKATPPTISEIIENARQSFSIPPTTVVRVKYVQRNKIIETNAELIDAFNERQVNLESSIPPPMLIGMPRTETTAKFTPLAPIFRAST